MLPLFQLRTTWRFGSNAIASKARSRPSPISTRMALGLSWMPAPISPSWRRLLVDGDVEAALPQRDGGGQPAQSSTDDCDLFDVRHDHLRDTIAY